MGCARLLAARCENVFSTQNRRVADIFRDFSGCIQSMYCDLSVRSLKQWERCAGSRCAEVAEA